MEIRISSTLTHAIGDRQVVDPRKVAYLDQLLAAQKDASDRLSGIIQSLPADKTIINTDNRGPVENKIRDALRNHQIEIDPHLYGSPQPVTLLLSMKPWKLRCGTCIVIDSKRWQQEFKHTDEDWRCDLCGTVQENELMMIYGNAGVLLYMAGICNKCHDDEMKALNGKDVPTK